MNKTNNLKTRISRSSKLGLSLGVLLTAPLLRAELIHEVCAQSESIAEAACTTDSMTAGMADGGARAQKLRHELDQYNQSMMADSRHTASNVNSLQAQQCLNQAKVARNLAEMSSLKARACVRAIADCSQKCSASIRTHVFLSGLSAGGDFSAIERSVHLAGRGRASLARCQAWKSQAQAAHQAAHENANNARTNDRCQKMSSSDGKNIGRSIDSETHPVSQTDSPASEQVSGEGHSTASTVPASHPGRSPEGIRFGGAAAQAGSHDSAIRDAAAEATFGREPTSAGHPADSIAHRAAGSQANSAQSLASASKKGSAKQMKLIDPRERYAGVLSMSVQAKDGITGPQGLSLFEKISKQYRRQINELILD